MLSVLALTANAAINSTISDWEMARAVKPKPTLAVTEEHMIPSMLNKLLRANSPAQHAPCEDFTLDDLEPIYETVYYKAHPEFDQIYEPIDDNRRLVLKDPLEIAKRWEADRRRAEEVPEEHDAIVASNCAEILMIYTHHLTQEEKVSLKETQLPLMSEIVTDVPEHYRRRSYTCGACHKGRGVHDFGR